MVFVPLSGMGHRPFPRVLCMSTAPHAISIFNSSNCPKDQKFVALQHYGNEGSAAKAAPSAYSRNMSADINTCSSEAL